MNSHNVIATCGRCGIIRAARSQVGYLCQDCRWLLNVPGQRGLPRGRWINRGAGVRFFRPDPTPQIGRPLKEQRWTWTEESVKRAHSMYVHGERTDWAREGERVYSRWAKARRTANNNERKAA